ncbi:hypothetical protein ABIB35_003759 [Arthrobacter sp. UYP6]|uniref:hypothetical protein n=1 Tax=Arthrobacter sp. UYP6 TaxID=1756378 RepID=UPI003397B90B
MSEVVGRAGFHATHTKSAGERGAILHEMMRELDPDAIEYWADKNPSIVVADEVLNEAYVNDGDGGFSRCQNKQEVIAYGNARIGKVSRKLREDKPDKVTGKMQGGTVTTSMIVTHLPKSMCEELPGFYPILDKDGEPAFDSEGNPRTRSRWVARDRDEARRYFMDVHAYLAGEVVPGGQAATLGFDIQHSESTPHAQFLMDTFAPDPKNPDSLRAEASKAWFAHRDVRDDAGKMKSGPAKMRDYHAGLKEHLVDLGYDISPDFDEEQHMNGYTKDAYGRVQEDMSAVAADRVSVRVRESNVTAKEKQLVALETKLKGEAQEVAVKASEALRSTEEARRAVETFRSAQAAAQQASDELEVQVLRLESQPADFEMFLDTPMKNGQTLRWQYEKFTGTVAEARRERVSTVIAKAAPALSDPTAGHAGLE